MATLAHSPIAPAMGDERFFLRGAIIMAILIVAGFSFQLAMGRSTFASPIRVHAHAILFMGWVAIYLTQNILVSSGRIDLHRKLGWIAAVWLVPMVISGFVVTVAIVRNGLVPFFFQPLQFLIFDPVTVLAFAGLTVAAIMLRRRTEWHRRLHFLRHVAVARAGLRTLAALAAVATVGVGSSLRRIDAISPRRRIHRCTATRRRPSGLVVGHRCDRRHVRGDPGDHLQPRWHVHL